MFAEITGKGFKVDGEVGQDTGRLLTSGRAAVLNYVMSAVAAEEIEAREVRDSLLGRARTREYTWGEGALVPPADWKSRKSLSREDIHFHPAGLTIFVKNGIQSRSVGNPAKLPNLI